MFALTSWGITHDGKSLIISDGTDVLRFYDPATLTPTRAVAVRSRGRKTGRAAPLQRLNALAWAPDAAGGGGAGVVYANVWTSDRIAVIDADTGAVRRCAGAGVTQQDVGQRKRLGFCL
jgi:glutaminyl-peptide cyclotransferase